MVATRCLFDNIKVIYKCIFRIDQSEYFMFYSVANSNEMIISFQYNKFYVIMQYIGLTPIILRLKDFIINL